jgi:hypothetical protein
MFRQIKNSEEMLDPSRPKKCIFERFTSQIFCAESPRGDDIHLLRGFDLAFASDDFHHLFGGDHHRVAAPNPFVYFSYRFIHFSQLNPSTKLSG